MGKLEIMLDNNAFDKFLVLLNEDSDLLNKILKNVTIYVNNVQLDELNKLQNKNPDKFQQIQEMIYTYDMDDNVGGYFGFYGSDGLPFGSACFQSEASREYEKEIENYLDKVKTPNIKRNNKADANLATVAKDYGCTVITNDGAGKKKGLYDAIKENNGEVMSFEELIKHIYSL